MQLKVPVHTQWQQMNFWGLVHASIIEENGHAYGGRIRYKTNSSESYIELTQASGQKVLFENKNAVVDSSKQNKYYMIFEVINR
ncbi:MAG: hypothetical protein KUG78_02840 [Kangiellaceae bacterium]|nr:hypothetical protein [Kangiellaceae bacterium]